MGCTHGKCSCLGDPSLGQRSLNSPLQHNQNAALQAEEGLIPDNDALSDPSDQHTPAFNNSNSLDIDLGLPRLSRLSAQYLPSSGSRTAKVPDFGFELRYSYLSQRGYYPEALDKPNQDSFCIHTQFGRDPNDHFFGVFDGHGEFGTQCSLFAKKHLCENLLKHRYFRADPVQAYHAAFTATNAQLHRHTIDDSMSGTTAITILVRGRTLYVANVGDSRAVLAERRGKELVAVDLSSDQTPFRTDECARVKLCGARVLTLDQLEGLKNPNVQCWGGEDDDDGDPPRLWVANGMYPGTAFTRSIGDKIAEQIGVMAVPEVLVMELTPSHPFFVLASDGVFEFLSSQAVVDMVAKYKDPRDACAAVIAESYRLWLQYETRTDDITIIVVHVVDLQEKDGSFNLKTTEESSEMESNRLPIPTTGWGNMTNPPVRHDVSGARLRALEVSLDQESTWEPPSESHPKTAEELMQIERALQGNLLFNGLTERQRHLLFTCMERLVVHAGDVVIQQGAEDDCFYIVESGEFEVLVSEAVEPGRQNLGTVVNRYNADSFSCFGELALTYNKPRQASVRAATGGSLWSLRREVFHKVLVQYTHESLLKTLHGVEALSHLTIAQLHHLSVSLSERSFKKGETLVSKEEKLSTFYIIDEGEVKLTFHKESYGIENASADTCQENECQIKKKGSYFGEWVLLMSGPSVPVTVVAMTDVVCQIITKEELEAVVGPVNQISAEHGK